ncbi:11215_t:CDS:2 [Funneliformis caledonium]|uniref:11215_t:CDS:1 n=1 Tax=Funneliformis caledonium TaxID=1117310 RepID=A0A9N9HNK0_9GLOM|nr:11215_t:CDS:2 [Funneliformis caledonium]
MRLHLPPVKEKSTSSLPKDRNVNVEKSETSPMSEICGVIQDDENDDKYDSDQYGEYEEDYY